MTQDSNSGEKREWWIQPRSKRTMRVYEGNHFNASDMKLNPDCIHVIEISALDELRLEVERLKTALKFYADEVESVEESCGHQWHSDWYNETLSFDDPAYCPKCGNGSYGGKVLVHKLRAKGQLARTALQSAERGRE